MIAAAWLSIALMLGGPGEPAALVAPEAPAVRVTRVSAPEKALRFEVTVPASAEDTWAALTTTAGVESWLWKDARVDLRPGGDWLVLYPEGKTGGGTIVSFVEKQRLELRAMAPEWFPTVRRERTKAVFELAAIGPTSTRVTLVQTGWKTGKEWDDAYEYLAKGNAQLLEQLRRRFAAGPRPQVITTTPRTASGERVVRVETLLRQSPERVWKAFATEEGLRCWIAPVVHLDLRTGGMLLTNYDSAAAVGGPGTISLEIMNYVENEEITFRVKLNDRFSERLRREDGHLQEVVELQRQGDGGTKVVSSMVGWGDGEEWDRAFDFFARGNAWSYQSLVKCFAR